MRVRVLGLLAMTGCLSAVEEPKPRVDAGVSIESDAGVSSDAGTIVVPGVTCSDGGFCWDTTYGGTFHAVAGTSSSFVVAVGEGGVIATWNGSSVSYAASPTTKSLRGVWFETPDRGWAVGDDGVMLEWNGARWNLSSSGTTSDLSVIAGNGSAVFAAGTDVMLGRTAMGWQVLRVPLPIQGSPAQVQAMTVRSATEVYVLGRASADFFMRFDGTTLHDEPIPSVARTLTDVTSCGDTLFLASNPGPELVLKRTRGSWTSIDARGPKLACLTDSAFISYGDTRATLYGSSIVTVSDRLFSKAAYVAGPNEVFFVGPGGGFTVWRGTPLVGEHQQTKRVTASANSVFRLTADQRVERREGNQWRALTVPGTGVVADLFAPADDELWVVRGLEAHHLLAGTWTRHMVPTGTVHVRGHGSTNVWFSGSPTIAQWNGNTVQTMALAATRFTGPVHVTATQTWVPTFSEMGLEQTWRRDGSAWRQTSVSAWRVWGRGDEVYFTLGLALARWNGTNAHMLRANVETRVLGVAGDELLFVDAASARLMRFNPRLAAETAVSLGTTERLAAIEVAPAGDVWLITEAGGLLHRVP